METPEFSPNLPRVLQRPNGGSLSVARVLKQAIELIERGEYTTDDQEDIDVIQGNLEILLRAVV